MTAVPCPRCNGTGLILNATLCVFCRQPVDTARSGAVRVTNDWAHDACLAYSNRDKTA